MRNPFRTIADYLAALDVIGATAHRTSAPDPDDQPVTPADVFPVHHNCRSDITPLLTPALDAILDANLKRAVDEYHPIVTSLPIADDAIRAAKTADVMRMFADDAGRAKDLIRRQDNDPIRLLRKAHEHNLVTDLLTDGVALEHGTRLGEKGTPRAERDALKSATDYLADPVHGARRAMLVLAGFTGLTAHDVASSLHR